MSLVGDVIMSARETIPDMPMTAVAPHLGTLTPATGGGLGPGTYYCVLTTLTAWGESLPSNEVAVVIANPNNAISFTWWTNYQEVPPSIIGVRFYFGMTPGMENQYIEYDIVTVTQPTLATVTEAAGSPPNRSSAYLPDTDGGLINAFSMFRWLNEGLNILSKKAGGIYDASGVPTIVGQSLYTLPQKWIKLTHVWYDGWELTRGTRSDIFYRSAIVAISSLSVTLKQSEKSIIETFPQPDRTAGSSLTTGALTTTSSQFPVNSTAGWVLPFGLAMLGGPPPAPFEIVAYAGLSGNIFSGLVRGLGGTYAQAWPSGALVSELNLRFSGNRMANTYPVGSSLSTMAVPDGWSDILQLYMDGKAINVQGDKTGASRKFKEFMDAAIALGSANRLLQGPVQIGLGATNEVYNPGLGGGWYLS